MRKILITFALLFVASFSFGQATFESEAVGVNLDSIFDNPAFVDDPELQLYAINNSSSAALLLKEQIALTERLDLYRKKKVTRKIIGGSLIAVGLGGLWYVAEMDEPIYQVGNDEANKAADEQKKKRRMIAWPSALVAGAGGIIFADSFKFSRWTKWELGVANMKVTQELYGLSSHKRKYFTDKESKLKKKSIYRKSFEKYR